MARFGKIAGIAVGWTLGLAGLAGIIYLDGVKAKEGTAFREEIRNSDVYFQKKYWMLGGKDDDGDGKLDRIFYSYKRVNSTVYRGDESFEGFEKELLEKGTRRN